MDYFIADPHFNDENIILFEQRPFKNVEYMNARMIELWNSVIKEMDTVYVLGDFSMYAVEDSILSKLNGKKILIKGNHDEKSNQRYRELGFDEVYDRPIIYRDFFILSHEPLYINNTMPYVNIFGHVHNSPLYKTFSRHHYCVCAERLNYIPISFDAIVDAIKHCDNIL